MLDRSTAAPLDPQAPAPYANDRHEAAIKLPMRHDSAGKHVSGEALYIDDLPEPAGMLHVYVGLSERAHARVLSLDLDAVRSSPGVVLVLTGHDVPGTNQISPTNKHDEPLLTTDLVEYLGQPIFAVAARTRHARPCGRAPGRGGL